MCLCPTNCGAHCVFQPFIHHIIFMEIEHMNKCKKYQCYWQSLSVIVTLKACVHLHASLTAISFQSFSHTVTTCSHSAFSNKIVPTQMHILLPLAPIYPSLDIRSSPVQCGKLFDGDTMDVCLIHSPACPVPSNQQD